MKTIQGYTYRVNEHIGKGYSSTVHKGIHDKTGQEVSIKVIQMAKLNDPINQKLLQLQVSALRCLSNNPHVLHLYDVYATKNNTYLITQLCESDLSSILKQRKTFPYLQALQILKQLIKGYHDIHQAGFLHRDIKPANIFLKNGFYKFGDFGFAIPINEIPEHKNYNVGSPVYMPPQTLKQNIYTVSCDLWAIGIVFYQILKGFAPWRAPTEPVLYQRLTKQPLDGLTVGLPEPARKFLARVLNLDINQRPTVEEMLNWPNQLQSMSSQLRHLSPFHQRGRNINNALQEIVCNTTHQNRVNFSSNQNPPGIVFGIQNKALHPMICSKTQQTNQLVTIEHGKEDSEYKQAYFFANNSINYVRFLHRVLKFILPPLALDLTQISKSINKLMFEELQILKKLFEGEGKAPNIEQWCDFLKSAKSQTIRKKIKKYETKYTMFHENCSQTESIQSSKVLQTVNTLIHYLDMEGYIPKMVVAADYLTTLYQLLHLRQKYQSYQFMKLSKIDLIMQGNPYNTSPDHLQKLKKKLLLIRP